MQKNHTTVCFGFLSDVSKKILMPCFLYISEISVWGSPIKSRQYFPKRNGFRFWKRPHNFSCVQTLFMSLKCRRSTLWRAIIPASWENHLVCKYCGEPATAIGFSGTFYKCDKNQSDNCLVFHLSHTVKEQVISLWKQTATLTSLLPQNARITDAHDITIDRVTFFLVYIFQTGH